MIRNIVFDLGKVLVSFDPEAGMRRMGLPEETNALFREKLFGELWERCDRIPYEEADIRRIFREAVPGHEDESELLWDHVDLLTEPLPYAESWLKGLRSRGFRLYILSNYGKQSFLVNSRKYDFLRFTEGQLISWQVEMVKPEPEIYRELCRRFALKPEESVFLDDRRENVEAARGLGFYGIFFRSYEQAAEELETLLGTKRITG